MQQNYHVQLPTPYNTIVVGGAKVVFEHRPSSYVDNDDEGRQIEGVPEYFHSWAKESITDWPQDMKMDFARDVRDGGCWTGGKTAPLRLCRIKSSYSSQSW